MKLARSILCFLMACSGASVALADAGLSFQRESGVDGKVTRIARTQPDNLQFETATRWEVANGAITYAAYALDCRYQATSQFLDSEKPAEQFPVPLPDHDWYSLEEGSWLYTLSQRLCLKNKLRWGEAE